MKKLKKILFLLMCMLFVNSLFLSSLFAGGISYTDLPADISSEQNAPQTVMLYTKLYFIDKQIEVQLYAQTGRFYVPFKETVEKMGGTFKDDGIKYTYTIDDKEYTIFKLDTAYPKTTPVIYDKLYISLFEFLRNTNLVPVFNTQMNQITLCYESKIDVPDISLSDKKAAYLRIEDIMADGMAQNGKYTDEGLEKLRVTGKYLSNMKQEYYIAWIPLYTNPPQNIQNDLTKDYNFYNASFLYTLDYLVANGGKIGLHGLTHQYGNDISADGFEFGKNTPFTDLECINRMLRAKEIARDLGYQVTFFEFPHYAATENHIRYAEKYFDVIYQKYTGKNTIDNLVLKTVAGGKNVLYIPTPADYIHSKYDVEGMKERINQSAKAGNLVSLFYHPTLDFEYIQVYTTDSGVRIWAYPSYAVLPTIVNKVSNDGYNFVSAQK